MSVEGHLDKGDGDGSDGVEGEEDIIDVHRNWCLVPFCVFVLDELCEWLLRDEPCAWL